MIPLDGVSYKRVFAILRLRAILYELFVERQASSPAWTGETPVLQYSIQ
jgi:hypothetical protein